MKKRIGLILGCSGVGDCLYAIPVIRDLFKRTPDTTVFDIFTWHRNLFQACPYIDNVYGLKDKDFRARYESANQTIDLFNLENLSHHEIDTIDFFSIPLTRKQLSFREKTLEYFPQEADTATAYDVVLNTSQTWPSRSWPVENWQRLADELVAHGKSVAVVGKDTPATAATMEKLSPALTGCHNLINKLSLDQTYFTIRKAGLFVTCQNGLSVLAATTEVEILVLDMSIEWSRRAIFRHDSPFHNVEYIKGRCQIYCGSGNTCPLPENNGEFKCIPEYAVVRAAVMKKAGLESKKETGFTGFSFPNYAITLK